MRQGHVGAVIELLVVGLPGVWSALFERGCTVFAPGNASETAVETLLQFGAFVILPGAAENGVVIRTADVTNKIAAETLLNENHAAALALEQHLERVGVLRPSGDWSDSGGI